MLLQLTSSHCTLFGGQLDGSRNIFAEGAFFFIILDGVNDRLFKWPILPPQILQLLRAELQMRLPLFETSSPRNSWNNFNLECTKVGKMSKLTHDLVPTLHVFIVHWGIKMTPDYWHVQLGIHFRAYGEVIWLQFSLLFFFFNQTGLGNLPFRITVIWIESLHHLHQILSVNFMRWTYISSLWLRLLVCQQDGFSQIAHVHKSTNSLIC